MMISDDPEVARRQWGAIWAKKNGRYYGGSRSGGGHGGSGSGGSLSSGVSGSVSNQSSTPGVFISYHYKDDVQKVNLLRDQAESSNKLEFHETSSTERYPDNWKTYANRNIKRSDVMVVMVGENTAESEAVEYEIEKAHDLDKPVIGMRVQSNESHPIPEAMQKAGDEVIKWELDKLQSQIEEEVTYGRAS